MTTELLTRNHPLSFNESDNSVSVIFSTGERVLRSAANRTQFYEDLAISNEAIDFTRLNNGAPVLKNHSQDFDSVIGVVERGNVEGNIAVASIKFSNREDVKPIIQDVKDGILRNISVGYRIDKMERVEDKNSPIPVMKAVRWTPYELSICPIGADSQAQIRSITPEDINMTEEVKVEGTVETRAETASVETRSEINPQDIIQAERKRITEIHSLTRKQNIDITVAEDFIGRGASVADFQSHIKTIKQETQPMIQATSVIVDSKDKFRSGVEQAIMTRAGFSKDEIDNEFRSYTLLDFAKRTLQDEGVSTRGDKLEIIGRAFTSTSDFPYILGNIANKSLKKGYEETPTTWQLWTKTLSVPDYKIQTIVSMSEFGLLDAMPEGAPYKYGSFSEDKEVVSIGKFGKMFSITREAIINDDTSAFSRIPAALGASAKRSLNKAVYDRLFANAVMNDGVAVFHANHGNLGSGALTVANLDAVRVAMSKQQDLAKSAYLNIVPDILLVPSAIRGTAQVLMTSQFNPDVANKLNLPNIVAGMATIVSDPLLDSNSATVYYAISTQYESFVVAFLDGNQSPRVEAQQGWNVDGVEMKVALDWGVTCIDAKPVYKSTGV